MCSLHLGFDTVSEHLQPSKESSTETFLPEKSKTGWSATSDAQRFLSDHYREHSLPLLHCVLWKLHGEEEEGPGLGGKDSSGCILEPVQKLAPWVCVSKTIIMSLGLARC